MATGPAVIPAPLGHPTDAAAEIPVRRWPALSRMVVCVRVTVVVKNSVYDERPVDIPARPHGGDAAHRPLADAAECLVAHELAVGHGDRTVDVHTADDRGASDVVQGTALAAASEIIEWGAAPDTGIAALGQVVLDEGVDDG